MSSFQIFLIVVKNAAGQILSTYQYENLCKRMSVKTLNCESEDLIEYMNANNGLAMPIEEI